MFVSEKMQMSSFIIQVKDGVSFPESHFFRIFVNEAHMSLPTENSSSSMGILSV
jgi:hypothetical protein